MNYNKKSVRDIDVAGKKVLLRCDFNVPMAKDGSGVITDDKRIRAALPTIQYLLEQNAAVVACSHMGKPKGEVKPELSLKPVAARLSELLGKPVIMAEDVVGPDARAKAAALKVGLNPIVCVGESLEQRELGVTMELIAYQVKAALAGVPADKMRHVVIAYEPLWAIGTGKTATAEQAGEVCQAIRAVIRKLYGAHVARSVTIQYGGSMNAKNAAELLAQPDVDGGLIGGASLKPADFVEIINAANQE